MADDEEDFDMETDDVDRLKAELMVTKEQLEEARAQLVDSSSGGGGGGLEAVKEMKIEILRLNQLYFIICKVAFGFQFVF